MSFDTQFNRLFTILDDSEYETTVHFKNILEYAVESAGFCSSERTNANNKISFNILYDILNYNGYELDELYLDFIRCAVEKAGFCPEPQHV